MISEIKILQHAGAHKAMLTYSVGSGSHQFNYYVEKYQTERAGSRRILVDRLLKTLPSLRAAVDNRNRWYLSFNRTYFKFPHWDTMPVYYPSKELAVESLTKFKKLIEQVSAGTERS